MFPAILSIFKTPISCTSVFCCCFIFFSIFGLPCKQQAFLSFFVFSISSFPARTAISFFIIFFSISSFLAITIMPVRKPPLDLHDSDDDLPLSAFHKKRKTPAAALNVAPRPTVFRFLGNPITRAEAARRWPLRYPSKKNKKSSVDDTPASEKKRKDNAGDLEKFEELAKCECHYSKAEVNGIAYELGDCTYVNAGEGPDFIGKIVEFFKTEDGACWFTSQWFFRTQDTAIGESEGKKHDPKRVFYSEVRDSNPLECLEAKVKIVRLSPLHHFNVQKPESLPKCDFYYDMEYDYAYSSFYKLPKDDESASSDSNSTICNDLLATHHTVGGEFACKVNREDVLVQKSQNKGEMTLLDLYSGCGGMSTGLCMGASLSGVKLIAKWAVDLNEHACKSLRHNHSETKVRNEAAEDFLALIQEWHRLCKTHLEKESVVDKVHMSKSFCDIDDDNKDSSALEEDEFEVEKIIGIRYVGSLGLKKSGLEFKVHWKGYGESEDSWEPFEALGGCEDSIQKFVLEGKKAHLLPLPGEVDVICGGPPCQGASGFNRFRNKEDPLADARNKQIVVYMDIVNFLKPRFVLMENVVDILKFAGGTLGRYALSRLVQMHYQVKLGLMVAGCYGLPQFRMRVFLWGASPLEVLPPYPLPTHDVVQKGGIPQEWERNMVAYDESKKPKLLKAVTLGDALSDLPPVENDENRDEMPYGRGPRTEFQRYIRLPKEVLIGQQTLLSCKKKKMLCDHRPLQLNTDDFQRTCGIPKEKGANFRNLLGVIVNEDNTVALDSRMERVLLPSKKPLVPDYAITFVKGRSCKPFGRLWWDETVPTVVTRAEPHNQAILHPEQDRVLTIRENARLQGFPDYYKLFGPIKERYIQVGNAVAVPVARALGYTLGIAIQQLCPEGPVMELPSKFPQGLLSAAQQITDTPLDVQDSA